MKKIPWTQNDNRLATFNSEISRGLIHTKEYKDEMRILQKEYNKKIKEHCLINGWKII